MDLTTALIILAVILLPAAWFIGGFLFKILWALWPLIAAIATGGLILWHGGMNAFAALPGSILGGVVLTWLWQRTRLYLRVDDKVGRSVFFD